MKKGVQAKHKVIIILLLPIVLGKAVALGVWSYNYYTQYEACRKWEELKSQNEQNELQLESTYPGLQQGISELQVEEIKYRQMCQEEKE